MKMLNSTVDVRFTTRTKVIAAIVVLLILLGAISVREGDKVVADCGLPTVSTPLVIKVMDKSKGVGDVINRLKTNGPPSVLQIADYFQDIVGAIKLWTGVMTDAANGREENTFATGWRLRVAQKQQEELAKCCVTIAPPQNPQGEQPPQAEQEPFDPKTLSISKSNGATLHGKWLAADALIQANLPTDEVPTFIAIADHESTMGKNIENKENSHVKGWWQMDQRYWKTGDWTNPYDNAKAVKKARDEGMAKYGDPYHHWVTKEAAQRDADKYDDLVGKQPKMDYQGPSTSLESDPFETGESAPQKTVPNPNAPGCNTQSGVGSGDLNTNVATWNVLKDNSPRNVQAGIRALRSQGANVIGLQELGDESLRAVAASAAPGMRMVDTGTAVPILYDENKYNVIAKGRIKALPDHVKVEPRNGDGGSVGPKWVTYVQLEDRIEKKRFYVLNTHMLVGPTKPKRKAAYERQLDAVLAQVSKFERAGFPVMVTGDFNQNKVSQLQAIGMSSSLTKATLGKTKIYDRVWSKGATPTTHQVLNKYGSDHAPVLATFVATTQVQNGLYNSPKVIWPVPGRTIEKNGYNQRHNGVDINRGSKNDDLGDKIVSPTSGTVTYVGTGKGYGEAIFIKTDIGGYTMIFGHTSKQSVTVGQKVTAGQKIGEVGNTGNSDTAHLHFGIMPGLTHKAALNFLNGKAKGFEAPGISSNISVKGDGPIKGGYTPRARQVKDSVNSQWGCGNKSKPCISTYYGMTKKMIAGTNTPSDHSNGNAVDIMINAKKSSADEAVGDQIFNYLIRNSETLSIKYVIWNGKIWSYDRRREGVRHQAKYFNHSNHVHVSVKGGTAA